MLLLIDMSGLSVNGNGFFFSFLPLSSAIDSLANEFALCHLARQLSLSSLALWSTSGGRKRGARSIDVNYANVTRDGACILVCVSSKGVDKGQAISFFPLGFFFFLSFRNSIMSLWRWTLHLHHQTKLHTCHSDLIALISTLPHTRTINSAKTHKWLGYFDVKNIYISFTLKWACGLSLPTPNPIQ